MIFVIFLSCANSGKSNSDSETDGRMSDVEEWVEWVVGWPGGVWGGGRWGCWAPPLRNPQFRKRGSMTQNKINNQGDDGRMMQLSELIV